MFYWNTEQLSELLYMAKRNERRRESTEKLAFFGTHYIMEFMLRTLIHEHVIYNFCALASSYV